MIRLNNLISFVKKHSLIIFVLAVCGLAIPVLVFAGLVPCGTSENPQECTLCDIFKMLQTVVNYIWWALLVIAPLFIIAGGIMILTAGVKPSQVEDGKRIITGTVVGLAIAFLSWTILNIVFNTLAKPPGSEGFPWPWNQISCEGGGVKEGGGGEGEEVYCVCEYVSANSDNNIRATQISGYQDNFYTCQHLCTFSSSVTYCGSDARAGSENMYCAYASDPRLNRQTACMSQTENWQRVGASCYATLQDCNNAADTQFRSICYDADGNLQCLCNSGAPIGVTDPCTSGDQDWTLFINGRTFISCQNDVLSCSRGIGSSCDFCELGCPTTGGGGVIGTCTGVNCSDSGLNICEKTTNNCSQTQVNSWNSQIQSAASGHSICSGIDTVKMVKAIIARESGGVISKIAYDGKSAGLMQLVPDIAERFKSSCGVTDTITPNWLTDPANAQAQICIGIEFLRSLAGSCGCDVRQLAAGYNGGVEACAQSVNCGQAARADGGECLICTAESFTRTWECLWDDNQHTVCNADRAATSFEATRRYVPQVDYCYTQF